MNDLATEVGVKEKLHYLRLARSNIGLSAMYSLIGAYGSAEKALDHLLSRVRKLNKKINIPDIAAAEREYAQIVGMGGDIVPLHDPRYPELLKQIRFPPFVLTVLGDMSLLEKDSVAIVGSRNASFAGKKFAQMIARCLGEEGYSVCSGMACGIDAAAHSALLDDNMPTIAVLGSGIDVIYPESSKDIYYQAIQKGLLISEFALGTRPMASNFPMRNRIIAGLSLGVVVVEATKNSGSLITAKYALDFGREVFAVPGSPFDSRYDGTNQLIKDGAVLADSCDTVIEILQYCTNKMSLNLFDSSGFFSYKGLMRSEQQKFTESRLDMVKGAIMSRLSYAPVGIDQIAADLDEDITLVLVALVDLDVEGRIERNFLNEVCLRPSFVN